MSILASRLVITSLLQLQLLYCALGIGYNLVSYVIAAKGGRQLSSTSPLFGAGFMLFYGLCLLTGYLQFYLPYRVLMALFLVSIGYSGVIKHFIVYGQQPDAYSSRLAWAVAIGINVYGLILNMLAAAGRFETTLMD